MKRLTERDEFGNADIIGLKDKMQDFALGLSFSEMNILTNALNRLAAYEEAEQEGRTIELPCKIGTHLWKVTTPYRGVPHVSEFEVRGFKTQRRGKKIQIEVRCLNVSGTGYSYYDKFCKTRAEAEAELEARANNE